MGKWKLKLVKREEMLLSCAGVQTERSRVQVRWESQNTATPTGHLAYCIEFLTLTGLWSRWRDGCPLRYVSPNAPSKADVWAPGCCRHCRDTGAIRTSLRYALTASILDCWA